MGRQPIYSHNTREKSSLPLLVLDVRGNRCIPYNEGFHTLHWHGEIQFILVLKGSIRTKVFEESVQTEAGSALFINRNAVHYTEGSPDCRYHSFIIPARLLAGAGGEEFAERYVDSVTEYQMMSYAALDGRESSAQPVLQKLRALDESCFSQEADDFTDYRQAVRVMELWLEFIRILPGERTVKPCKEYDRIQSLLSYIHTHYEEPVTVEELAGSAGISKTECQRCFKKYVGKPAYQYLQEYRLLMGAQLLKNTGQTVTEIAGRAGYESCSSFIQHFKRKYQCTPQEYRRREEEEKTMSGEPAWSPCSHSLGKGFEREERDVYI